MRNLIIIGILLLSFVRSNAMDFTKLSKDEPITVIYSATEKSYVDVFVNLNLANSNWKSVAVRILFTIKGSTFSEYAILSNGQKGAVKRILLDKDEELKAELFLHESGLSDLSSISGNLDLKRPKEPASSIVSSHDFMSDLWSESQLPLFRVIKDDETPKTISVKFNFTDQFEFDKLFYKVKMISPTDGILIYDEIIDVNVKNTVSRTPKNVKVELPQIPIKSKGTYYFQVQLNMAETRVNGVRSVEYELIDQ